jgi:nickel transport protein
MILSLAVLIGMVLCSDTAQAHKVKTFAYVEGDSVVVEAYFSKSAKARDSKVLMYDSSGTLIHEGITDEDGIYRVKGEELPKLTGDLRIEVEVGEGHKAEYTLRTEDLPETVKTASEKPAKSMAVPEGSPVTKEPAAAAQVDMEGLEAVIRQVVREENTVLTKMIGNQQRMLLEMQDRGPTVAETVGGLGWIMGLVGIAAFFMSRKRNGNGTAK